MRYRYPAAVDCNGKSICERLSDVKVTGMHGNVMEFMIRGRLTIILGHFRAQGSALTRNVSRLHGSKILLQRAILYRHERILLGRGDCRPGPKKIICKNSDGFPLISRDASIRLGSRFVWHQIWVSCCCGLQRDHLEHPYEKD